MRVFMLLLLLAAPLVAGEARGRVTQVLADAVYVDVGSAAGVAVGDTGSIERIGAHIADVEVVTVAGSQARLRILRPTRRPIVGDEVVLSVKAAAEPEGKAGPEPDAATKPAGEPKFEPLLEQQKRRAEPAAERNIFHGRVSFQQIVQSDREGDLDYSISIFSSDGMFDRIAGSPWSLRWSGNVYYRTGDAFDDSEFDGAQLIVFDFEFARPLRNGGLLRFGRFLPRTLRYAGYFDGFDIDVPLGENTRVGTALGFKPTPQDLTPSSDEPAGLVYFSYRAGTRGKAFASGSYGVLASAWKGDFDRAALLIEQVAELGTLRLDANAEIDFDVGGAQFRSGTSLTQLNAYLTWRVTGAVTLRAGADRWERLDTAAERDRIEFLDPLLYEDGFWRTWVGAAFVLPGRLRLDLEYDRIDSETGPTTNPWRATLEHYDPFGLSGSNVSLTVYGLESFDGDGYGGLLNFNLPFSGGKWMLLANAGFRYLEASGNDLDVTSARLAIDYGTGRGWNVNAGVQWLNGDGVDSLLVDFRIDYRF